MMINASKTLHVFVANQSWGRPLIFWNSAASTLAGESNAVADNPIVLVDEGLIVSGGNFHAEPVAFAADQIALAIAETGAICQRRIALMVDPNLSFHLPPFLDSKTRAEFRVYDC